jgi:MFS family permease
MPTTQTPGLEPIGRKQMLSAVVASSLGWALDLFDLFIVLYVAPVIGKLFFPSTVPTISLAAVYASFAVTLLMRPIGSALFGSYADRHGRKGAMIAAVVGVGVSTALFGALPTIQQAGLLAPFLYLALRLVQGVFVGGVVASTHTIGTESVPVKWRGAMSGLIGGGGSGIGALLASLSYLAASELFPGEAFAVWGWRFMFFTGILSAVLGVFIFSRLEESPLWTQLRKRRASAAIVRSPVRTLFSAEYRGTMAVNIMLTTGAGAGYYLTSGYLPSFLKLVTGVSNRDASLVLILGSLVGLAASIAVGHASTFLGRRRTFLIVGGLRLVLLPLCYFAMAEAGGDVVRIALFAMLLTALGNGGYAPLLIFLNERFPTSLRSTGTGLSWNIGFGIGGMVPAVVSLMSPTAQDLPTALAAFLVAISVLFLAGAVIAPETRGNLR